MKEYATNAQMKSSIDILQITFKCCGSKSYKEWFYVSWFDPQLGGVELEKWSTYESGNESEVAEVGEDMPQFVSDDAPFSCCSSDQLRPCVHHGVLSRSPIYRYDPQRLGMSLWKSGCRKAIQRADRHLMRSAAALLICFFILQVMQPLIRACLSAGTRLLQTGLFSTMVEEGPYFRAWLFGTTPAYQPVAGQMEPEDSSEEDSNYWEGERPWASSPLRNK
ncbi:peripherin-2-like [Schistocerca gregaria]|uniref:peripherin-2-like n=1 Tax=Schistocerca gregaria TaxID=7010 RepID=UPI00211E5AEA|nr:peripherin-2-like [Schistocerca gregaria]